ncbi:THO complex subunit 1-like [Branchiostoma lanceolatum]|uniref:THO complex subunit 1-like n=1 Tax=Branchiostoma lanceolatum TaxID=7740 RepID=UPI00345641FE
MAGAPTPSGTVVGQLTPPSDSVSQRREGVRKYFFFVKEEVSSRWKDLAFFLDLDDPGIANIANRNPDDKSRCMDMLEEWLRRRGENATVEVLMEALSDAELQNVVDGLKNKFPAEAAENDEPKGQN